MERYIETPNLPQSKVSLAAVGNYPEIISALNNEGIRTVSFENTTLPSEISKHQDMLLCHLGRDIVFLDPSQNEGILKKEGLSVYACDKLGESYPDDVRLNVAVGHGFYIYNPLSCDTSLTDELNLMGYIGIQVNQGYSKCSTCFVTEKAIITEDISIYKALEKTECDVLFISKGDIFLSRRHYGFFGGSSGKISYDTLAVTGELKYHRDGEAIKSFCEKHGVKIKELIKGRIIDIGGILPLAEKR